MLSPQTEQILGSGFLREADTLTDLSVEWSEYSNQSLSYCFVNEGHKSPLHPGEHQAPLLYEHTPWGYPKLQTGLTLRTVNLLTTFHALSP